MATVQTPPIVFVQHQKYLPSFLALRMKCGIGIRGRRDIRGRSVRVDGPIFTWKRLRKLPPEL